MIYQQQEDTEQEEVVKASYKLGAINTIKVKFEFRIPITTDNFLVPIISKIELLNSDLASLMPPVNSDTPDISWTTIDTSAITTFGFLYLQTTFAVNGSIDDTSLLEKYLKKCKTTYNVKGAQDGIKEFYVYDSVHISANKHHLVMRK
ncbi:MAG: hypothetical protein K2P85_05230 [Flavobacteriaceae bacterium]|nr:hypothetical protein [Flavobacteriaceae bacterium]